VDLTADTADALARSPQLEDFTGAATRKGREDATRGAVGAGVTHMPIRARAWLDVSTFRHGIPCLKVLT
jgi:hypothetical protein